MNANQLINMIFRLFVRKAVSKGIDAGMNRMSGGRKANATPEQQGQTKQQVRQARQAARMARRAGRM